MEIGYGGAELDDGASAFVGGDAGESGAHYAFGDHAVCVAEGTDGYFYEYIMFIELFSWSWDIVDFVRFFELSIALC